MAYASLYNFKTFVDNIGNFCIGFYKCTAKNSLGDVESVVKGMQLLISKVISFMKKYG